MRRKRAFESKRYLGIDLSGAKNNKTTAAIIEYYERENKVFLLEIFERINKDGSSVGDSSLLELINLQDHSLESIGVSVPLTLPPCIECTRKTCPMPAKCTVPTVKWMREFTKKVARREDSAESESIREFTPYTQRPAELWIRHEGIAKLPFDRPFEVDEALGGNKAPLTARMQFLQRHLKKEKLVEVSPKFTLAVLAAKLKLPQRWVRDYRKLERGAFHRSTFLETLAKKEGVFLYEKDQRKLSSQLGAFDAFVCAYTALLEDLGKCQTQPKGFPKSSGWTVFPAIPTK